MFIHMQGQTTPEMEKLSTHTCSFGPRIFSDPLRASRSLLMVWANCMRPDGNPPNIDIGGKKYRSKFSNISRANVATLSFMHACLTSLDRAKVLANNNGLALITYDQPERLKARIKGGFIHDTVWCPSEPIAKNVSGFILDYEVQDSRGPSNTLAFLTKIRDHFPRTPRYLYTNNTIESSYSLSGLKGNELKTAALFTGVSLLMYDNNFDLPAQLSPFGAKRNIFITVDMKQTLTSLTKIKNFVEAKHLLGINIWRNGETDANIEAKLKLFRDWQS